MTLTLNTHIPLYIQLDSEKSSFHFFYRKAFVTKFDLAIKSARRFWRRRFFKGFYHIWAWRLSLSLDPDAANQISFPLLKDGST